MTQQPLIGRQMNGHQVITSLPPAINAKKRIGDRIREGVREFIAEPDNLPVLYGEQQRQTATIACVIPAYNEESTIASVVDSILAQTRPPEVIHVVVNNTDDGTLDIVTPYTRRTHERTVKGQKFWTTVHVHDMGDNPDKKVGALNFGWRVAQGSDYLLGVDGDTTLDKRAVESLFSEMEDDERIGGLSAIYSIDHRKVHGVLNKFLLIPGQKQQFAAFNMDNLLRGRNMAVLGGQCSLFRMSTLEKVCEQYHQKQPWVRDSEVEDSLLSLQIKKVGFSTKISAHARADVGPMESIRALHAQQVKWNFGAIDLFWPGTRGNTKGQPFHPNLRMRWYENFQMFTNIVTRLGFALLLAASLSISAFVFNPVWLVPPVIALLLHLRVALSMKHKSPFDVFYAGSFVLAEVYTWIRMGHFVSAWVQFFARAEKDNWASQARAEKGGGGAAWVYPFLGVSILLGVAVWQWQNWSLDTQTIFLAFGWPLLYLITITQTLFMFRKLIRRQRGFQA